MSSPYDPLERVLHRIPEPWSRLRGFVPREHLQGTDAEVEQAMQLARELLPVFASVPIYDSTAPPPLEPSDLNKDDLRGWGHLSDLLRNRFQTIDRFDRGVVREILAAHTPVPDRFLDAACDRFRYLRVKGVALDALAFIQQHRIGQRACAEGPELVRLGKQYWRKVSLDLQYDLVNVPALVAGVAAFELLDEILASEEAPARLKAEVERVKIRVDDQDHPVPGRYLFV